MMACDVSPVAMFFRCFCFTYVYDVNDEEEECAESVMHSHTIRHLRSARLVHFDSRKDSLFNTSTIPYIWVGL